MKKFITVCQVLVVATVIYAIAHGDQIIQYNEQMVGANHPVLADTLNRGFLIQHNAAGVHTSVPYDNLTGVPTSFPWDNITSTPTTLAGYGITDAAGSTTTLPWDNITSRPTINSVTVTGTVLDNVLNYPTALARLASPTFTGTVTVNAPNGFASDNVAITGGTIDNVTLQGVSSSYYDPTSSIQDQINAKQTSSSMLTNLSSKTIQDNVTVYDDREIRFGTDNDFKVRYKSADATLVVSLDNGDVMCTFSKTGNLTCTGEMSASQFESSGTDNTFGINVMNTSDPTGANLAAGLQWMTDNCARVRSTDNTVTFSAGCLVKTFAFGIDNVITSDDILLWKVPRASTILQVNCYASTDNVVGVLSECTAGDVTSCTAVDSSDWTVTNATSGFSVNSGFENASIAAGAWLKWVTTSVGTTNSNKLSCTVQYRE